MPWLLNFFSSFSFIICSKTGAISYKAQSQDEDALVQAAARLHMVFVNKNANTLGRSYLLLAVVQSMALIVEMMICLPLIWCIAEINFNASIIQYEVLDTLEFTSDRKRMSVVMKDCQNGKIFLLSKGADEAIIPYACAGNSFSSVFKHIKWSTLTHIYHKSFFPW